MQLSDYCSVLVFDFCPMGLFAGKSQADVPNENIEFGILKGEKDLCASGRLVDYSLKYDIVGKWALSVSHCVLPDFAASYAAACDTTVGEFFLDQLAEVSIHYSIRDAASWNLALNPHDPNPGRNESLDLHDQTCGLLRRVWFVFALLPFLVKLRSWRYKAWVDFQHVRSEIRVLEDHSKRVKVTIWITAGQSEHHMVSYLESRILQCSRRLDHIRDPVVSVDSLVNIVVEC